MISFGQIFSVIALFVLSEESSSKVSGLLVEGKPSLNTIKEEAHDISLTNFVIKSSEEPIIAGGDTRQQLKKEAHDVLENQAPSQMNDWNEHSASLLGNDIRNFNDENKYFQSIVPKYVEEKNCKSFDHNLPSTLHSTNAKDNHVSISKRKDNTLIKNALHTKDSSIVRIKALDKAKLNNDITPPTAPAKDYIRKERSSDTLKTRDHPKPKILNKKKKEIIVIDDDELLSNMTLKDLFNKYLDSRNDEASHPQYNRDPANENKETEGYYVDGNFVKVEHPALMESMESGKEPEKTPLYILFVTTPKPMVLSKLKKKNGISRENTIKPESYKPINIDLDKGPNLFMTTRSSLVKGYQSNYGRNSKPAKEENFNMFLKTCDVDVKDTPKKINLDGDDSNFNLFSGNALSTTWPMEKHKQSFENFGNNAFENFSAQHKQPFLGYNDFQNRMKFQLKSANPGITKNIESKGVQIQELKLPQVLFLGNSTNLSAKENIGNPNFFAPEEENRALTSKRIHSKKNGNLNGLNGLIGTIFNGRSRNQKLDSGELNLGIEGGEVRSPSGWKIILVRQSNEQTPASLSNSTGAQSPFGSDESENINSNVTQNINKEKINQVEKDKEFLDNTYDILSSIRMPDISNKLEEKLHTSIADFSAPQYCEEEMDSSDDTKQITSNIGSKTLQLEESIKHGSVNDVPENFGTVKSTRRPLSLIIQELEEALENPEDDYSNALESGEKRRMLNNINQEVMQMQMKHSDKLIETNHSQSKTNDLLDKDNSIIRDESLPYIGTTENTLIQEFKYDQLKEVGDNKSANALKDLSNSSLYSHETNGSRVLPHSMLAKFRKGQNVPQIFYVMPMNSNITDVSNFKTIDKIPSKLLEKIMELQHLNSGLTKKVRRSFENGTYRHFSPIDPNLQFNSCNASYTLSKDLGQIQPFVQDEVLRHNASEKLQKSSFFDSLFHSKKMHLPKEKGSSIGTTPNTINKKIKDITSLNDFLMPGTFEMVFPHELTRTKRMVPKETPKKKGRKSDTITTHSRRSTDTNNSTDQDDDYNFSYKFQALQSDLQDLQNSILSQIKSSSKNEDKNLTLQIRVVVDVLNNTSSYEPGEDTQLMKRHAEKTTQETAEDTFEELKNIMPMILDPDSPLKEETRGNGGRKNRNANNYKKRKSYLNNKESPPMKDKSEYIPPSSVEVKHNLHALSNNLIKNITHLMDTLIENVRYRRECKPFRKLNKLLFNRSKNDTKNFIDTPQYYIFQTLRPLVLDDPTTSVDPPWYRGKQIHEILQFPQSSIDDIDINISQTSDIMAKCTKNPTTSYKNEPRRNQTKSEQNGLDNSYNNITVYNPPQIYKHDNVIFKYISKRQKKHCCPFQEDEMYYYNSLKQTNKGKDACFWKTLGSSKTKTTVRTCKFSKYRKSNPNNQVFYFLHPSPVPDPNKKSLNQSELFEMLSGLAVLRNSLLKAVSDLAASTTAREEETNISDKSTNFVVRKLSTKTVQKPNCCTETQEKCNDFQERCNETHERCNETQETGSVFIQSTTMVVSQEAIFSDEVTSEGDMSHDEESTKTSRRTTKKHRGFHCHHHYKNHTKLKENRYNPDKTLKHTESGNTKKTTTIAEQFWRITSNVTNMHNNEGILENECISENAYNTENECITVNKCTTATECLTENEYTTESLNLKISNASFDERTTYENTEVENQSASDVDQGTMNNDITQGIPTDLHKVATTSRTIKTTTHKKAFTTSPKSSTEKDQTETASDGPSTEKTKKKKRKKHKGVWRIIHKNWKEIPENVSNYGHKLKNKFNDDLGGISKSIKNYIIPNNTKYK